MTAERLPVLAPVLFVCTMNAVRSPMAAALLAQMTGAGAASAGVRAGEADPMAAEVMAERGLDISGHVPRRLKDMEPGDFALVIALSHEAEEEARGWAAGASVSVEYWPVADPTLAEGSRAQRQAAYRAVRDQLAGALARRFLGEKAP